MIPTQFLKRFSPNTPDWLLGGMLLVSILWLVVLPIEILQALTKQDFLRPGLLVWIVRSLYIFGFGISMSLISPWTNSFLSLSDIQLVIVFSGLFITSPVYFGLGALISTKKVITITLGILLLVIKVVFGCIVTIALMFAD